MFPYIVCMSLVAFASGILNTWSRFAVPAFTPVLLNLSMIGACLFLTQYFGMPIYALAAGVMIGGAAQLVVQRSEGHTSELQSLMRISYAGCCLKKKTKIVTAYRT